MKIVYDCIDALGMAVTKWTQDPCCAAEMEYATPTVENSAAPVMLIDASAGVHDRRYMALSFVVLRLILDQLAKQNVFWSMRMLTKFKMVHPKMPEQSIEELLCLPLKHPNGKSYDLEYTSVCKYVNEVQRCTSVQDCLTFDIYTLVTKDKLYRKDAGLLGAVELLSGLEWLKHENCTKWLKEVKGYLASIIAHPEASHDAYVNFMRTSFASAELCKAAEPLACGYDIIYRIGQAVDNTGLTDTGKAWLFTRTPAVDEVLYKAKGFAWLSIEDQKRTKGRLKKLLPSTSSNECMLMSSTLTDLGKELLEEAESEYDESDKEKMLATVNSLLRQAQLWLDAAKRRVVLFEPKQDASEDADEESEGRKSCCCRKRSKDDDDDDMSDEEAEGRKSCCCRRRSKDTDDDTSDEEFEGRKSCRCRRRSKDDDDTLDEDDYDSESERSYRRPRRRRSRTHSSEDEDSPTWVSINVDLAQLSNAEADRIHDKLRNAEVNTNMLRGEPYYEDGMTYDELREAFYDWAEQELNWVRKHRSYSEALGVAMAFMKDLGVITKQERDTLHHKLFKAAYP